ncbi:DUF1768 domain-containing protein [Patescibacteria group bacterium]|nr:DUF1768 domain-containing protein [Patescibacteria group bacterium]
MIREFQGKYRWLSNFWPVTILYEDRVYPTVEHAYQAQKTSSLSERDWFTQNNDPSEAKAYGQTLTLRSDWNDVKIHIMKELTRIKYQNNFLRTQLINTGNQYLQEGNTWGDTFWGVNIITGQGKNNMGHILMEIRDELFLEHSLNTYLANHKKIVLFDGVCNLCNWWVRFLIRNDPHDTFRFAPLQSEVGRAIQAEYNINILGIRSVIVIDTYTTYTVKSSAIFSLARSMGGLWSLVNIFWILPVFIRDGIYDIIARNRYRWFGKQNTCMVPTNEVQHKFLT